MNFIEIILNLVFAFLTSVGFAFYFQVPKRAIVTSGLVGMLGWISNLITQSLTNDPISVFGLLPNFINGVVISILGEYFGKKQSVPAVVYYTTGIIQPVPGGSAIMTFYSLARNQLDAASEYFVSTFMLSAVIAFGILIGNLIMKPYKNDLFRVRKRT